MSKNVNKDQRKLSRGDVDNSDKKHFFGCGDRYCELFHQNFMKRCGLFFSHFENFAAYFDWRAILLNCHFERQSVVVKRVPFRPLVGGLYDYFE